MGSTSYSSSDRKAFFLGLLKVERDFLKGLGDGSTLL